MPSAQQSPSLEDYASVLADYVTSRSEAAIERAWALSQVLVECRFEPEQIVSCHWEALQRASQGMAGRRLACALSDAHEFLLEILLAYSVYSRDYLETQVGQAVREAEMRTAEEHERASQAERIGHEKAEVLAVVAHELRSPLTVVRGHLQLAAQLLSRGQKETALQCLDRASGAADRLAHLAAELMEASRGEPRPLECRPLDLTGLVEQTCASERPAAQGKSINLVCHPVPVHVQAFGDADALSSVIGNLVSNAIRYTPAGGRVDVCHGVSGGWARLEVRDTGMGMPPEVLEHIFEKFYRGPEAHTAEARGLGLGLSLAQQLVRAHGGRIEVESSPGQGSAFRVLLPLRKPGRGRQ